MITITFKVEPKDTMQVVDAFIDFVGNLGMYGGGGWDEVSGEVEWYLQAHSNCNCDGYPKLHRITPKVRNKMLEWLKDRGCKPTWKHTR